MNNTFDQEIQETDAQEKRCSWEEKRKIVKSISKNPDAYPIFSQIKSMCCNSEVPIEEQLMLSSMIRDYAQSSMKIDISAEDAKEIYMQVAFDHVIKSVALDLGVSVTSFSFVKTTNPSLLPR